MRREAQIVRIVIYVRWRGDVPCHFSGSLELFVNDELVLSFTFFVYDPRRLRRKAALLLMIVRIRSFE